MKMKFVCTASLKSLASMFFVMMKYLPYKGTDGQTQQTRQTDRRQTDRLAQTDDMDRQDGLLNMLRWTEITYCIFVKICLFYIIRGNETYL